MLFAQYIVQQTDNARVILTGRGVHDAKVDSTMQDLPRRVEYRQLDITNAQQVNGLFDEFPRMASYMWRA